ncbi:DUF5655 domain-containing protein [Microbacterium immunditiarum]|uniref:DUF5655 domain-containing protein n=1 Tax=Microbacterium immunditiarum TaxID=337480 RepID=A0A7Y9GNN5_9MICO|nr:hypothetical protein [Microbacterium immunditiarum]
MTERTPEDYFGAQSVGLDTFLRVHAAAVEAHPDVTVRVSKSQVALRRRRGFAYLWIPGRYLRRPTAPVVLSLATDERLESARFKEVVHPGPWMHHLEIHDVKDIDDEVVGWLISAADDAG